MSVAKTESKFTPLSDEQLYDLECRFDRIYEYTPEPRPRSRWAPPGSPDPVPAYQVVFRVANPGEWDAIMSQANSDTQKARSPKNLAKATIVAVVVGPTQTIHAGEAHDRAAAKPVREAFDRLLQDWPGIPENVVDKLSELAGVVKEKAEKD